MLHKIEGITVIRHLRDTDDLVNHGTDNPLEKGQDQIAFNLGCKLREESVNEGYRGIFLISSPKTRATETTNILRQGISQGNISFKTRMVVNPDIRELDQGQLKFPECYKSGTRFEPLKNAWKIFWAETFGENHDLTYKFGDSVAQGRLKYPELLDTFEIPGECYKEQAIRLYTAALKLGNDIKQFERVKFKPIIITHGAPFAIYRELDVIANDFEKGLIDIPVGGLVQLSWDYYNKRTENKQPEYGQSSTIPATFLNKQKTQEILVREIDYLNRL